MSCVYISHTRRGELFSLIRRTSWIKADNIFVASGRSSQSFLGSAGDKVDFDIQEEQNDASDGLFISIV